MALRSPWAALLLPALVSSGCSLRFTDEAAREEASSTASSTDGSTGGSGSTGSSATSGSSTGSGSTGGSTGTTGMSVGGTGSTGSCPAGLLAGARLKSELELQAGTVTVGAASLSLGDAIAAPVSLSLVWEDGGPLSAGDTQGRTVVFGLYRPDGGEPVRSLSPDGIPTRGRGFVSFDESFGALTTLTAPTEQVRLVPRASIPECGVAIEGTSSLRWVPRRPQPGGGTNPARPVVEWATVRGTAPQFGPFVAGSSPKLLNRPAWFLSSYTESATAGCVTGEERATWYRFATASDGGFDLNASPIPDGCLPDTEVLAGAGGAMRDNALDLASHWHVQTEGGPSGTQERLRTFRANAGVLQDGGLDQLVDLAPPDGTPADSTVIPLDANSLAVRWECGTDRDCSKTVEGTNLNGVADPGRRLVRLAPSREVGQALILQSFTASSPVDASRLSVIVKGASGTVATAWASDEIQGLRAKAITEQPFVATGDLRRVLVAGRLVADGGSGLASFSFRVGGASNAAPWAPLLGATTDAMSAVRLDANGNALVTFSETYPDGGEGCRLDKYAAGPETGGGLQLRWRTPAEPGPCQAGGNGVAVEPSGHIYFLAGGRLQALVP